MRETLYYDHFFHASVNKNRNKKIDATFLPEERENWVTYITYPGRNRKIGFMLFSYSGEGALFSLVTCQLGLTLKVRVHMSRL